MLELRIVFIGLLFLSLTFTSPVIPLHHDLQNSLIQKPDAALNVKTTIEEVQKMLELDPELPRLTRGEIEDLFEQVTREEYEKSLIFGDVTRAKHMRALMLVLPYNIESTPNDNLQEIFNRPPVTKVVSSGEVKPPKLQKVVVPSGKVEIISVDNISPTTYKPFFKRNSINKQSTPTTYRPNPEIMKTATTSGPTIFVTNTPPTIQSNNNLASTNNKFSSHYNAKNPDFYKDSSLTAKTTSKPKITPELEEILESLGFAAQSQSRKRFKLEEPDEDYAMPIISSLIKQDRISFDEYGTLPESFTADDFRKSLIPEVKPEDYVAFKPLRIPKYAPKNIHPELEDYLKMFGIINERNGRSEKSLKSLDQNEESTTPSTTTTNTISPPLTSSSRPARIKRIDTSIEEGVTSPDVPFEEDNIDTDDYVQLQQLLSNIRQLQQLNVSLNDDAFKKLDLKNYNLSETLLSQGPDPIQNLDTIDPLKNEIKRQSDNAEPTRFRLELSLDEVNETLPADVSIITSPPSTEEPEAEATSSTSETSSTSTTSTTTTEASRRDSSGMDSDAFAGLDPVTEQPLPMPRKNGFYFLADWNSFLEVGDGDEKVVVRFNPTVGDPSRFIPVTVP